MKKQQAPVQAQLRKYLYQKAAHNKVPLSGTFELTPRCNMNCRMCYIRMSEAEMRARGREYTAEEWIEMGKACAKEGMLFLLLTGGEPFLRKDFRQIYTELKKLGLLISINTNATLIDEKFADEMLRVKNFIPAISLEGDEVSTDSRRGQGTYQKVVRAMKLLHEKKLPYGISSCYTSVNYEKITSDTYYNSLIDMGAYFIWYFHYMPVGNDAAPELLPNPKQRETVYHRIRHLRATKPLFAMDFQNDAEYVGGCIAGGKRYLHINANGDVDPCVFVHYSNANIRECTLLEALQSPIFMAYHDNMPFNDNMLQPCPMLENPERLRKMVAETGAHSTDPQSPETADHLCGKCDSYAKCWAPEAERLWRAEQEEKKHI